MPTVVGERPPNPLEICALSDPPPFEHNDFDHSTSTARAGKNVQLAVIGNGPRAFQRVIDEPCTLPLSSPKGGTKRGFAVFVSVIQLLPKEVCYKVSLCENFQRQSCSYIILLSHRPWIDCGWRPYLPKICAQSDPPLQKASISTNFASAIR